MMPNDSPIKTNKILQFLYDIQEKYWVPCLLLVRLSAVWFSLIIGFLGEAWGLINNNGTSKSLSLKGWICTVVIFIAITLGEVSKKYIEKKKEPRFEVGAYVLLSNLRSGVNSLCSKKYKSLITRISELQAGDSNPAHLEYDPIEQIDAIAHEMEKCLRLLLKEDSGPKIQEDDFFVGIVYQFPNESPDWHWGITAERGLSIDDLFKDYENGNVISTLRYLLSLKGHSVFFNSKATAAKKGYYVADDLDEFDEHNFPVGSIACYEGEVKKNNVTHIKYVIMITSYGVKFASDENDNDAIENVKHNMRDFVVTDFQTRIQNELCSLYISHLCTENSNYDEDKEELPLGV